MGGEKLSKAEVDIILGDVDYPEFSKDSFKDTGNAMKAIDARIDDIRKRIKDIDQRIVKSRKGL